MPPFFPREPSWLEECLSIAREVFGPEPSDEDLKHLLWEHTGFPSFFDGDPRIEVRRQLIDYRDNPGGRFYLLGEPVVFVAP